MSPMFAAPFQGLRSVLAPARTIPRMPWSAQGSTWSGRPITLAILLFGLWLFGVGEAALVNSSLGNTPWTVLAEGIADHSRLDIGGATIFVSVLVLIGWIPLRQRPGLGTLANVVVIGLSLDAMCLLASLPLTRVHRAFPVAAADYFFATPLRSILSVIAVNGLPIDRHHGRDDLEMCRELLSSPGQVLIIFPEGTRTCSGAIGRFRSGVARLAAGTDTPVIPCHLSGAFDAWPKGRDLPRPLPVHLRIGRPRTFAAVDPADHGAVSHVSSQLREDVVALGRR